METPGRAFHGSLPVIPTPFLDNQIDFDSLSRLFEHIFPDLEGCTIAGSTGESVSLSTEERLELMRFCARNKPAGKRIIAGLTHTNLSEMIALARLAEELGLDGGLVPCPYYFPNSFEMVLEFFRELDRGTNLPIVFYDNPVYTKTWLTAEQVLRIVEACPHVAGVKMTDHALEKIPRLVKAGVPVYVGDDITAFRSLLLGAAGSMIIAPAVFPAAYQESVRLLEGGHTREALRLFSNAILPFIYLFGPGDEVAVTKALYKHLGIFRSGETRLPLLPCTPERLEQVLIAYELCQAGTEIVQHGS
jgi:4-hydroxy-tetrahydrodipicolinate synthase